MTVAMPTLPLFRLLSSLLFLVADLSSPFTAAANPAQPDPAPVQPFLFPTSPPSTIPAFPEQSDVAGSCPLDLPDDLFSGISRSCSSVPSPSARLRCCPALAAWLYAAYSSSALASRALRLPAAADLPVLPDDSESCIDGVEKALRAKGVVLGRVNDTCDVVYCYCGVRLRPMTCPGGLAVAKEGGRWVAMDDNARRIEKECAKPGLSGCSRCLRSLYQVKPMGAAKGNGTAEARKGKKKKKGEERHDCQLMALTWLLAKNRTLYLPAATKVLRALMMTPDGVNPVSCTLARDGKPFAVDFEDDSSSSSLTVGSMWALHQVRWICCTSLIAFLLAFRIL